MSLVESEVIDDGIACLVMNRPQSYNSLSRQMIRCLITELDRLAADDSLAVFVLQGNGRGFCAGHDLEEIRSHPSSDYYRAMMNECCELMLRIQAIPQPVIAKVHGVATAAGCQLVASCDLAYASRDARFATPGVLIGLFCSTPMVALTRNVARKHAMEMLLTGDFIDAEKAQAIGLVNDIVDPAGLDQKVMEIAQTIAGKSCSTISSGKKAFYEQIELPVDQAYRHMTEVMVRDLQSADAREGICAFLEKRKPVWPQAPIAGQVKTVDSKQ